MTPAPFDATPYVLAASGALAAFAHVMTSTPRAEWWTGKSLNLVIVGFFLGGLWQIKIGTYWPIVVFESHSTTGNAFLVGLFSYTCSSVIAERGVGWLQKFVASKIPGASSPTP